MSFVPVANCAAVDVIFDLDGQTVENTLYFTFPSTPSLLELQQLIDEVNSTIRGNIMPLLSSVLTLLRVIGTLIDVADGLTSVSTVSLPLAGGSASESAPSNVAACISLRTNNSGRSFRGRNYIPGIPNDQVALNTMLTGFTNSISAGYAQLRTNVAGIGWTHVIVSRFSGFTIVGGRKVPTPRVTGIATPVSAAFFVDETVDSQRRRLPGRGR